MATQRAPQHSEPKELVSEVGPIGGSRRPPTAPDGTADSRELFRDALLAKIPRWYSPWGHLAGTVGSGACAALLAISRLQAPALVDWLTVPSALLFANLVEWVAHKELMHRRRRLLPVLYDRHTPEHHRVYRYDSMSIRSAAEFRLVLVPAMGVLGIVLLAAPVALLTAYLLNANAGWLFLMTSAIYVTGYELTHLCYHLPEDSVVYRLGILRTLREHHARHHIPSLMQRRNFNVTVPFGDYLFGSIASRTEVNAALERERSRERDAEMA